MAEQLPDSAADLIPRVTKASRQALEDAFIAAGADKASIGSELDNLIGVTADAVFDIVYFENDAKTFKRMREVAASARKYAAALMSDLTQLHELDPILAEGAFGRDDVRPWPTIHDLQRLDRALSDAVAEWKTKEGRPSTNDALRLFRVACEIWQDRTGSLPSYSNSSEIKSQLFECLQHIAQDMYDSAVVKTGLSFQAFKKARQQCADSVKD